jgi:hypothetical protein
VTGFVERCGLWSDDQRRAAVEVARQAETLGVVRLSFPDQHGVLHGKTIVAAELDGAFHNGVTSPSSLLAKDTSHRTVFPVFTRGGGFDMPEMGALPICCWCRTRKPSRCCPGRRIAAGCSATSTSPTAGRCRSAPASYSAVCSAT